MDNKDRILDALPLRKEPTPKKSSFLKGVVYTLLYYASALGLAAVTYAILGHPYVHAPGLHHWLIFLTFAGGVIWALAALVTYFTDVRTWKLRGIIFGNVAAILSFPVWFYSIVYQENHHLPEDRDELSMSQNGDTTILYHNDNIVYMKVQDSVLLNFVDTLEFQRIVDSTIQRNKRQVRAFQNSYWNDTSRLKILAACLSVSVSEANLF